MANIQILPYAQQMAAIQRQRKLADLLQEQGMQPSTTQMVSGIAIPTSPWETASKLAQSLAGAYAQSRSDKEEAEAKKQAREEYKQNIQDFISAIGPQKAYTSTPVMEQSSDEDRTEMAPKMQWSDETGQMEPVQDWKETLKPGLSRNQAIARLLEMQGSDNPYIAAAAPTLTGLLPKQVDATDLFNKLDMSKLTPESVQEVLASGDIGKARFVPEKTQAANLPDIQENWAAVNADRIKRGLSPVSFEQFYNEAQNAKVASTRATAPAGYRYDPTGALEPIPGGPADVTRPQQVPISTATTASELHQNSGRFKTTAATLRSWADKVTPHGDKPAELPLGPVQNTLYKTQIAAGRASDEANYYQDLQGVVQEQVNNLLNLAKGPQTEQDALRIQKIIMNNWNDPKVVATNLLKLADKLENEAQYGEDTIIDMYKAYNQPSPYSVLPPGAKKRQ